MPAEGTLHVRIGSEPGSSSSEWKDTVFYEEHDDVYVSVSGQMATCSLGFGDDSAASQFKHESHDPYSYTSWSANYYIVEFDGSTHGRDQIVWLPHLVTTLSNTAPSVPAGYEAEPLYAGWYVGEIQSLTFDVQKRSGSGPTGSSLVIHQEHSAKDIGPPYDSSGDGSTIHHWTPAPSSFLNSMPTDSPNGESRTVTIQPNASGDLGIRLAIDWRISETTWPPPPGFDGWRYGADVGFNFNNGSATAAKPYTIGRRSPVSEVTVVNDVSHTITGGNPAAWQDNSRSTYLQTVSESGNKAVAQFAIRRDVNVTQEWFDSLGFSIDGYKAIGDSISVWLEDASGPVTGTATVANQQWASWHWERHRFAEWDAADKAALWATYSSVPVGSLTPLKLVVRNDSDAGQLYSYVGLRNAMGSYVPVEDGTEVPVWRKAGVPNPEGGVLSIENTLGGTWHTCDNREDPPPGGTAGDGGAPSGWYHASWMRSKASGPDSGRTGRLVVRIP